MVVWRSLFSCGIQSKTLPDGKPNCSNLEVEKISNLPLQLSWSFKLLKKVTRKKKFLETDM
jgi:hypothetical protein